MIKGVEHSKIYKTKDYDQFKLDNGYNRELVAYNIKKLIESIKTIGDKGECFPIVVDENGLIIDGQHRFTVRKQLGLPIYYIISLELDSAKLGLLNEAVSKWKSNDFYKVAKDSPYLELVKEITSRVPKQFSNVSITAYVFGINKKALVLGTKEDKKYQKLLEQKEAYIAAAHLLSRYLIETKGNRAQTEYALIKKMTRYKVQEHQMIEGVYNEIIAHLYKNEYIK